MFLSATRMILNHGLWRWLKTSKISPGTFFIYPLVYSRGIRGQSSTPSLATSYNNLSLIYQDLGQLDRARPYAQKAVDILTALFPNGHPNLDVMRKNLDGIGGH
jgi:hypothetical protein